MDEWGDDSKISTKVMGDWATNIAFAFIILFFITLPFIGYPNKPQEVVADVAIKMPGNLMIWIRWPDDVDIDVDLWVQAPGDKPIGYSNRAGKTFNLLRDDLGSISDTTKLNYEVVFGRDMPDGRYTVNIHLYRNGSELTLVPVNADISINHGSSAVLIAKKKVVLTSVGEEITVANFTLYNGKLAGDIDGNYVPLRDANSGIAQ
jgi:hypothetical protein